MTVKPKLAEKKSSQPIFPNSTDKHKQKSIRSKFRIHSRDDSTIFYLRWTHLKQFHSTSKLGSTNQDIFQYSYSYYLQWICLRCKRAGNMRYSIKTSKIPITSPKSPIRFKIIAFIAALFAWIRVNQKLISKYEQRPTPSHPTNIWIKLSAVTKINIKNVNSDK